MLTFRPSCGECFSSSFGSEVDTKLQGGERLDGRLGWWFWLAEAIKSIECSGVLQGRLW
jgi:hypothetical protein